MLSTRRRPFWLKSSGTSWNPSFEALISSSLLSLPRGYRTILPDGWNKETHHLSPQRYSDTALLHSAAFISTLGFLYIQYLQSSTLLSIQYLQFYTPGTFSELRVTHKHIFWINRKYTARCPAEHKYWLQWCCSAAAELLQAAVITQTFGKSSASNIFMLRDVEQNFHVISHNIFHTKIPEMEVVLDIF